MLYKTKKRKPVPIYSMSRDYNDSREPCVTMGNKCRYFLLTVNTEIRAYPIYVFKCTGCWNRCYVARKDFHISYRSN